ncbi:RecQ family ATP-dependent DNA helicase [Paraliobacillus ryukyuensis]|uniref:RecQ family ATP-dependent DNA helicase n=1 Tax=Paraliobacillus ryukyuensis TaxID=200904 RepID=UPI0009A718AD|nr:ATP-dependent DNA helicase RecQ [Paraliobacillus ryukyuensis]
MSQLETILQKFFGHTSFREGQKEIIDDVMIGNDVLGVLPTGSGKSICYQIPAMLAEGTVIVISPLLSLMEDQVKQLKATGFKDVVAINSFVQEMERSQIFHELSSYKLIYLSPEMIQNKRLLTQLNHMKISLFVIDEAHCISQWGHEFRPDYLKLKEVIASLNAPPVLALTATATPEVQDDIMNQLERMNMNKHIYAMDRENITFSVQYCNNTKEKLVFISDTLQKFPVPTMIYFSSKKEAESIASHLHYQLPNLRVAFYHGGMDSMDRVLIQQQFMAGQLDIVCCTSAFGMGINKTNVRLIIHYHIPTQIESFIQEVGRAGRDGLSSVSVVLYAPYDEMLPKRLIDSELPTVEQVKSLCHFFDNKFQAKQTAINEQEIMVAFDLNEIQWRFIKFQFEKYEILKDNHIMSIYEKKNVLVPAIEQLIHNRYQEKLAKLNQMVNWIHQQGCRRRALFQPFQSTIKEPTFYCCDSCDFQFEQWSPVVDIEKTNTEDWRTSLAHLFDQQIMHSDC